MGTDFLTIAEVAKQYQCSTRHVRRLIASGRLRAYKLGVRLVRIRVADAERALRPIQAQKTAG